MKHQTKSILGGLMGNIVEAYDISLCYFLSAEIARHFLGDVKEKPTVILTLLFIAYLAKPIGAFLLGLFSDLYGRKNVLLVSIFIMGLSTGLIGLIPDFNKIGIWASILLLGLRVIQSMALGSEFLNSSSLLVESGTENNRGYRGCWSSVGVKLGYLMASLIVVVYHQYLLRYPEQSNLWRVPFLLAIITTLIGLFIRSKMPESLAYILYYANRKKPTTYEIYKESFLYVKKYPFLFYFAFCSSFLSVTTGFFFYLYIPLHASQYAHITKSMIMMSNNLSLLFVSLLIPLFGYLSDTLDRLKMLLFACMGFIILSYPFMQAINYGSPAQYIGMQLLISIPCACYYSVATVLLTELFPLHIRCTALSIVYSIAASLAAGFPPLLSNYMVHKTHLLSAPSIILILLAALVILNSKILVKRYRQEKNIYKIGCSDLSRPIFSVYYKKPLELG